MKPKRVPRLWCARQGLLPLGLKAGPLLDRVSVRAEPIDKQDARAEKIRADDHAPAATMAEISSRSATA